MSFSVLGITKTRETLGVEEVTLRISVSPGLLRDDILISAMALSLRLSPSPNRASQLSLENLKVVSDPASTMWGG